MHKKCGIFEDVEWRLGFGSLDMKKKEARRFFSGKLENWGIGAKQEQEQD